MHLRVGRPVEAVSEYQRALNRCPNHAMARYRVAVAPPRWRYTRGPISVETAARGVALVRRAAKALIEQSRRAAMHVEGRHYRRGRNLLRECRLRGAGRTMLAKQSRFRGPELGGVGIGVLPGCGELAALLADTLRVAPCARGAARHATAWLADYQQQLLRLHVLVGTDQHLRDLT